MPTFLQPLFTGLVALLAFAVAHMLLRHSRTGMDMPWCPYVIPWFVLGVLRSSVTQRAIGGGRLDNMVSVRLIITYLVFFLMIAQTGLVFLFPICTALAATIYVQWSGSRTWPLAAVLSAAFTAIVQFELALGMLPTLMSVHAVQLSVFAAYGLALTMMVTIGMLTRQKELAAAALAAEQTRNNGELVRAATHDGLTGLLNRSGLEPAMQRAAASAAPGAGLGMVFMDLDGFKEINDREGHHVGDEILQAVAARLSRTLRASDVLARMGGDEFVALLSDLPDDAPLRAFEEKVHDALQEPFDLPSARARISVSVGWSFTDTPGASVDVLMRTADAQMYRQKRANHARPRRATNPTTTTPAGTTPAGTTPAASRPDQVTADA